MNERRFMQVPIPDPDNGYVSIRTGFNGLNETASMDSGEITGGRGFTTAYLPEIRSIKAPTEYKALNDALAGKTVTTMAYISGILLIVANDGVKTYLFYVRNSNIFSTVLSEIADERKRSFAQFNVYTQPTSITGKFDKRILIFPDKKSLPYDVNYDAGLVLSDMKDGEGNDLVPDMDIVTVFNSRLFGVKDGRIYASGFNSYVNFNLDTAEDINEANAWMTETQSNPKAQNTFTALTVYDGHPVAFKPDYMQQIYGTKNPFRISDIGEFGCVSDEAHCQALGYLFFIGKDGVYRYSGGYPTKISDKLSPKDYTHAKLASYEDEVYMLVGGWVYTYCVRNGTWAKGELLNGDNPEGDKMVTCADGVLVYNGGTVYKLRSSNEYEDMELCLYRNAVGTTDNKRLKELAALYKMVGGELTLTAAADEKTVKKNVDKSGTHAARLIVRGISNETFNIMLSTSGEVTIYYLQYVYAKGGNTYV